MVPPSERWRPSNPCDRDLSRRRKRTRGQTEIEVEGAAKREMFERTRATALDIIAAVDVHRFDAVLCENVIEFATDWELFDWWLSRMKVLVPLAPPSQRQPLARHDVPVQKPPESPAAYPSARPPSPHAAARGAPPAHRRR